MYVNLDTVVDGKSALKAYRDIINDPLVQPTFGGESVTLAEVLRHELYPSFGFREGVLPPTIVRISMDHGRVNLSYPDNIDQEAEAEYWEQAGYDVSREKRSLEIRDLEGQLIATVARKRVLIEIEHLDEFIDKMR